VLAIRGSATRFVRMGGFSGSGAYKPCTNLFSDACTQALWIACAGPSAMDDVLDAVWIAAEEGDLAEVQNLVGQDPFLLNEHDEIRGRTPVMAACINGHLETVRWLLDQGAATNERDRDGWTALHLAGRWGHTPTVSLLMQRGTDPTIADESGETPLMLASEYGHLETVRSLLDHPSAAAILNHRNELGETALWRAYYGASGDGMKAGHVVKALLESGADPTTISNDGSTPLMAASCHGRRETVRWLLDQPSAVVTLNHRNRDGETALWRACHKGRGRAVSMTRPSALVELLGGTDTSSLIPSS
jgi:ankyrin repeat protein